MMLLQLKLSPLTWGLSAGPPRGSVPHLSPAHRPAAAVKPVMAQDHPQLHPSLIAAQLAGPSISSSVTCALSHSVMCDSATPWTAAHQAHLSMGFSRQEHWSGLPFPPPGLLPNPGIKPMSPVSPALAQSHGRSVSRRQTSSTQTDLILIVNQGWRERKLGATPQSGTGGWGPGGLNSSSTSSSDTQKAKVSEVSHLCPKSLSSTCYSLSVLSEQTTSSRTLEQFYTQQHGCVSETHCGMSPLKKSSQ